MNILFVYKYFPILNNNDSGIGNYLSGLISTLKKENKIFVVTTSDKNKVIKKEGITIYVLKYPLFNSETLNFLYHTIRIAIVLPSLIFKHKIQLIEFANWESEGVFFATLVNRVLMIPIVIRLHTTLKTANLIEGKNSLSEKMKEVMEKIFVKYSNAYLTSSTFYHARECRQIYSIKKNIEVIPLGVKLATRFTKDKSNRINVLFVGRLERRKGIDILLNSIATIIKKFDTVDFYIVGRGNPSEDWLTNFQNYIPYNLYKRFYALGYINNKQLLRKLYINSDICIVPSRYESFGLTVIEAMNYGKPVIASNVGGIKEIIKDGLDGILIKPESSELTKAISNLVLDKEIRKTIGTNARKTVKEKFDLNILGKNTIDFYRKII